MATEKTDRGAGSHFEERERELEPVRLSVVDARTLATLGDVRSFVRSEQFNALMATAMFALEPPRDSQLTAGELEHVRLMSVLVLYDLQALAVLGASEGAAGEPVQVETVHNVLIPEERRAWLPLAVTLAVEANATPESTLALLGMLREELRGAPLAS